MGWYAIDFDATLAEWGPGTSNPEDVLLTGQPIPKMVDRVRRLIDEGRDVRIFTARVGPASPEECLAALQRLTDDHVRPLCLYKFQEGLHDPWSYWLLYQTNLLHQWCRTYLGVVLPLTATKDFHVWRIFDDRAVGMVANTGETMLEVFGVDERNEETV